MPKSLLLRQFSHVTLLVVVVHKAAYQSLEIDHRRSPLDFCWSIIMYNALSHMYIILYIYTPLSICNWVDHVSPPLHNLSQSGNSNRMEMDGMPLRAMVTPTLHIDATVWLYRNGNGLHPYLRGSCNLPPKNGPPGSGVQHRAPF